MSPIDKAVPIGFVGLGTMGAPMARWLLMRSWKLHVYARRAESSKPLVEAGAVRAPTPAALARTCPLVFLSLSDEEAVEQVVFGPEGLRAGLSAGGAIVDTSTISADAARRFARQLAGAGIVYLDAPVSGGQQGAEGGSLACMIGGPAPAVEAVRPVIGAFCRLVTHVGDVGAGQTVKACNQVAAACALLGVGDALALARAQGVDPEVMRQVLLGGTARSFVLEKDGRRLIDGHFEPGFRARLMCKDLHIALRTAGTGAQALQATALAARLLDELCASGGQEMDWSAVGQILAVKDAS